MPSSPLAFIDSKHHELRDKRAQTMRNGDRIFEEGAFGKGIGYPPVHDEISRVRTIAATHSRDDLDFAQAAFEVAGRELDVAAQTVSSQ